MTSTTNVDIHDMVDTIQGGITGTYKWLRDMGLSSEDCLLAITIATKCAMADEYCKELIKKHRSEKNADKETTD